MGDEYRKQKRKRSSHKLGFTFIELLVVVGMVGLATGIGVAAYNNFGDKQKAEQAAKELVSNLRYLQSNAVSGVKSFRGESCADGLSLDGWYASFAENEYYLKCSDGSEIPAVDSERPVLAEGADFTSTVNLVKFNPVYGDTEDLDDVLPITVTISGKEKIVKISPNGNVSIE